MTDADERVKLTFEQAVVMLPDKPLIHTFRQAGPVLIGADWLIEDIMDAFKKYPPELSGDAATGMKHGIVLEDDRGYLFIETKERV